MLAYPSLAPPLFSFPHFFTLLSYPIPYHLILRSWFLRSCVGHPLLEKIIQAIYEAFAECEIRVAEQMKKERLRVVHQMTNLLSFLSVEESALMANIRGKKDILFIVCP